jgi:hypothetical protein
MAWTPPRGHIAFRSVEWLSKQLGKSPRSIQYGLGQLRDAGWFTGDIRGGKGRAGEYRPNWAKDAKPCTVSSDERAQEPAPYNDPKGATFVTKGCNYSSQRVQNSAPPLTNTPASYSFVEEKPKRAGRVTTGFKPSPECMAWASEKGLSFGLDLNIETEKFINHWMAASGNNATKRDWNVASRNWILKAKEFHDERTNKSSIKGHSRTGVAS